jgi:predicted nucleic acid-binding protein
MANPTSKLRVFVDANVLVAGTGWPRWAYAILQHAVVGDFQLVLSKFVIEEARHHIGRVVPQGLPRFEAMLELSKYETAADPTPEEEAAHPDLVRDKKDIPVALAVLQAKVTCLVSSDKDLTESDTLKQQVKVVLPAVFLRDYMGWSSEKLEEIRYRNWPEMS